MKLLQTSALSGLGTLFKILTGMISLKVVALYTGPEGVAILGQFMTLVNVFSVIAGGGISLGVIKYVAEYRFTEQLREFLASAAVYTFLFSLLTMVFGWAFSSSLSQWILGSPEYELLIKGLSLIQLFIALHLLFCATINGFEKIRTLVAINILTSFISMGLIVLVAIFYPLKGALFAFVFAQGIASFVSLAFIYREKWFSSLFSLKMKLKHCISLTRYSVMNIISALTVPMGQIIVRNDLGSLYGWEAVGYWQAVVRLSDAYLLFITTALTAYYLPRLSRLERCETLKNEIIQSHAILLPLVALILVVMYVCRVFLIHVLYSANFEAAINLFLYQFIGDFFRIAGWLFTYLLLAKSWTKMYIFTEVTLSLLFIIISHSFARTYGLVGVTYSFALTYLIYWTLMASVAIAYFNKERQIKLATP
jgi:PST family polysaccharide transporter